MFSEITNKEFIDEAMDAAIDMSPPLTAIPSVTFKTVFTNKSVTLDKIGKPAVLIFCTRETSQVSETISRKIDTKYELVHDVFIGSIVDLHVVPYLFRFIAESAMVNAYHDAFKQVPERLKERDCVVIMPDWEGAMAKALGLRDLCRSASVVVLNADGTIVGMYQGERLEDATLILLEKTGAPYRSSPPPDDD